MTVAAFPLSWPRGWSRNAPHQRQEGTFSVALGRARDGLLSEVTRLGGKHPVISSNLRLRQDGLPYAQQGRVDDPGIALYFDLKGKPMCFACDRFTKVEANLRAIELSIAALRGLERWGASDMLERAFQGFLALPAPGQSLSHDGGSAPQAHPGQIHWSEILGVSPNCSTSEARDAYKRLCGIYHPDKPDGDADKFHSVQNAWRQVSAEHGAQA